VHTTAIEGKRDLAFQVTPTESACRALRNQEDIDQTKKQELIDKRSRDFRLHGRVGGTRDVCGPLAIAYGSDENEEYELIYSRWESSWRGCFNI
jgi:hypothetical protein